METLLNDIRYGIRSLLKRPSFTAVAVVTLALGIGANTAIFSVVNGVLLRPLPFVSPDRLVMLWGVDKQGPSEKVPVSHPNFVDWRSRNQVFEQLAGFASGEMTLTGRGDPLRLRGALVTANLFPLLGVTPQRGRTFLPEEDQPGTHVVILSHGFWQRRFGSDPNVLQQTLTLDGQAFAVVGVMPPGFAFPLKNEPAEFWISAALNSEGPAPLATQRGNLSLNVVGRLRPGVTPAQAQAEMETIVGNLAREYPDTNEGLGVRTVPLHEELVGDVRRGLLILFGAVVCVLLIACANVANLLLAQATGRHKEIAIRAAVGASRGRIIRQLLVESLLLALCGGALGLLLAGRGTELLVALLPEGLPPLAAIGVDQRVLAFTILFSLVAGVAFGLAPAWQASRTDLTAALKEGGHGAGVGLRHMRVREALVVAEIAIALILLTGAGLLINSFLRLQQVKPGFDPHNVLTFNLSLPTTRYPQPHQVSSFYQQLVAHLEALPGVTAAGVVSPLPLSGRNASVGFSIEGVAHAASNPFPFVSNFRRVDPGYFKTMGIQIRNGRGFIAPDNLNSTPVAIVNETFARQFFPAQNPVGKRITPGYMMDDRGPLTREIVGVVADVKHVRLSDAPLPELYVSQAQLPLESVTVVARTSGDPNGLISAARNEVQALDRDLPLSDVKTLNEYLGASVARPRFNMLLLGLFAAVALILTAVGLYGVMAFTVTQRTHEIGIRLALGAQKTNVLGLMVRSGVTLALVGVAIGLAGSFALTRLLTTLLFGVTPTDPMTFATVSLGLILVALLACYVPARRATKVDPLVALRYE
jgi:putative ABC transport system permease protein